VPTLLLINYKHPASQKYRVFLRLRMVGVKVEGRDLYHFSGLQLRHKFLETLFEVGLTIQCFAY
jgi:hypothetical protein